jgi:hypothetical protein
LSMATDLSKKINDLCLGFKSFSNTKITIIRIEIAHIIRKKY